MQTRMEKHGQSGHPSFMLIDRISGRSLAIISAHVIFFLMIAFVDGVDYKAKLSIFFFLSAVTLWVSTKLPAGFIALASVVFIILMKGASQELLYLSLSEEVVWLMVGAFIIGEAVEQSGLTERFIQFTLGKSRTPAKLRRGMISFLFASVFIIPSTSARAAMARPLIIHLASRLTAKEKKILTITLPIVILMSTSAALIGAGSHVIGVGLLETAAGQSISYLQWLMWGLPFALFMTIVSSIAVKRMMRGDKDLEESPVIPNIQDTRARMLTGAEIKTLIMVSLLIIGWMTDSFHGYDLAFVSMIGAIALTMPKIGVITWKQGVKAVSWNLILFVAAAAALGKILVVNGVADWMEGKITGFLQIFTDAPDWIMAAVILIITVTSHLYITSHTTRAIVLVPGIILFSQSMGMNPHAAVFISLIGMNYCITFPVSSKALLLFYEDDELSYDAGILARLSAILMPLYISIAVIFYCTYWQWTGMSLY
ncbi:anion transporter [Cytobacillus firmus]|uniref:Anion transporter n=2 Tax=Cytobacillus TaxID=2675230 RepID=A0A366JR05_CYTFI|nr:MULTISPECIES: SLC13 family permease [Cytobacillus]RBP90717.1 anion transporter [Cytobacillus firmus]TDX46299.1 anion transporter [Cytobacillus oceanisediminis]